MVQLPASDQFDHLIDSRLVFFRLKGVSEGTIIENTSYYIFTQCTDDAFEAFPNEEYIYMYLHMYKVRLTSSIKNKIFLYSGLKELEKVLSLRTHPTTSLHSVLTMHLKRSLSRSGTTSSLRSDINTSMLMKQRKNLTSKT